MSSLLLWAVGIIAGLAGIGFTAWLAGYTKRSRKEFEAEREAQDARKEAEAAKKVADIFARPAGSKSDIVGRL